jgi:hypothetical protein
MTYIDWGSKLTTYPYSNIRSITPPLNPCLINPPQNDLFVWMDSANPLSYPGTGTTWNDLSPTGKVGTLINGVLYKPDNCGVFECDAIDDYITINVGRVEFIDTTEWTFSLWFKPRLNMVQRSICAFQRTLNAGSPTILLRSLNSTTYRVYFQGGYRINIPYVIDEWQNFTMVRTGGDRKTYKNGVLLDTRLYAQGFGPATFFSLNQGFGGMGGCDFGVVNMWKRGFTDSEVLDLFNLYKNRFGL